MTGFVAEHAGRLAKLWTVSAVIFAGVPCSHAQVCPFSGAYGTVAASLGTTPCVSVKAPQGRKFVVFTKTETYVHWQNGNGCMSSILGSCDQAQSLTLSISGIGYAYTLSGTVAGTPPGFEWADAVGPPQCVDTVPCTTCLNTEVSDVQTCATGDQVCLGIVQAKYNACIANLAMDSVVVSTRMSSEVMTLPAALTSAGPATLTMSTTESGGQVTLGGNLQITASLYSDTRFTLTQSSSAFRPRDARDPAAYCNAADQAGQMHDGDCHPQYTVQFACNTSSSGTAGNRMDSPLLLAAAGNWPRSSAFGRRPRFGLPRLPILPFISSAPPCPSLAALYQFQLAPQTQWLRGTSTNFGADTATDPDYIFEKGPNIAYNTDANLGAPQNGMLSISRLPFCQKRKL